jgi:hypothetical protein
MRAQDRAAIESLLNRGIRRTLHSERERPLGGFKVLRLYSAEPPHNVNRFSKVRRGQSLVLESLPNEICSIHLLYVTFGAFVAKNYRPQS